tara:strand:+ start:177 stop:536 length:360 start_codon:yes stop_codon:yes gene_type:complete
LGEVDYKRNFKVTGKCDFLGVFPSLHEANGSIFNSLTIMKKLLIGLAFSLICFSGFAKEDTFNACGAENVASMIMDISQNLCSGTYTIVDLCDNNHQYVVEMSYDGPNSSCGELPVIPE